MMPVMGGVEATQIIRKTIPEQRQPKIVALTADAVIEHRQVCLDAGMDDVLTKPVKQDLLFRTLRKYEPANFRYVASPSEQRKNKT